MNAYNGYLERKLAEEMAAGDPVRNASPSVMLQRTTV